MVLWRPDDLRRGHRVADAGGRPSSDRPAVGSELRDAVLRLHGLSRGARQAEAAPALLDVVLSVPFSRWSLGRSVRGVARAATVHWLF